MESLKVHLAFFQHSCHQEQMAGLEGGGGLNGWVVSKSGLTLDDFPGVVVNDAFITKVFFVCMKSFWRFYQVLATIDFVGLHIVTCSDFSII